MMRLLLRCTLGLALLATSCGGADDDQQADSTTTGAVTTDSGAGTDVETETTVQTGDAAADDGAGEATDTTITSPGVASQSGVGDSLYPGMGNGGYDVQSYDLDFVVDVEANHLDATAAIVAVADTTLEAFNLDLSGLTVGEVTVDGTRATFSREGDELTVVPPTAVKPAATFETVVIYAGTPEPVPDVAVPFGAVGWNNREGVVYIASEPSGAKSYFPNNNHPTDTATYRFRITADSALVSAATGTLVEEIDNGDTTTTVWEMNQPMTTYAAAIYVGDFERRESTTADGLTIRNYVPPAMAAELDEDLALTADVIDFYAELFGQPYPFDAYGTIVLPFDTGFALENQSLSVHGADTVDAYVVAHEIMHQWMGNSITVADWQEIWLLEGFATYLPLLYFEQEGLILPLMPRALHASLQANAHDGPAEVMIEDLFGISVYLRGALTLHALRVEVGDDQFRQILRTFYERRQGQPTTTDQLRDIAVEVAGADAGAVLDLWLFGPALPPYPGEVDS